MVTLTGGLGLADPINNLLNGAKADASSILSSALLLVALVVGGLCLIKAVVAFKKGGLPEASKWIVFGVLGFAVAGIFGFIKKFGVKIGGNLNKTSLNQLGMLIPAYYAYTKARISTKINR